MHTPRIIRLINYATSDHFLHSREQARQLMQSERLHELTWVEMDFSGIRDVRTEFIDELFQASPKYPLQTWIVPRNYSRQVGIWLSGYFCKLQYLRDLQMQKAFDPDWVVGQDVDGNIP